MDQNPIEPLTPIQQLLIRNARAKEASRMSCLDRHSDVLVFRDVDKLHRARAAAIQAPVPTLPSTIKERLDTALVSTILEEDELRSTRSEQEATRDVGVKVSRPIGRPPISEMEALDVKPIPEIVRMLHDAVFTNDIPYIKGILATISFKDMTTQDAFGDTALGLAIKWRRVTIIRLLKDKINETMEGRVYA